MTTPPSSPDAAALSRRTVIKHAGLAAAALAGLSACTNYGSGGGTPSSAPATSAGAGGAATAKTADIPVGGGKIFADIQAVITQPTEGEFKAFSSICTHQNCPVTEVTDTINCSCHGSRFSIADGSVVNPPATNPLGAREVTVDGDELTVA
ncbi:MAG TPA: Rieske (2Fe-2S) protein [Propionibacteriaceae bacterium]|nr:Rieske (2Fe-2S) protein [Propionibacteriaceae bacterium]